MTTGTADDDLVRAMARAVIGDPAIKAPGLVDRVASLETTVRRMLYYIPLSLFAGSTAGALVAKLI